jgi:MarR family transcriptional regulator, transcriptional regulator for hemolysin
MTQESFAFLLSDAARLLRRRFDARARALGVTRAQWQVLLSLSRLEGINQAGLADRLEVETITLCRMIDRLSEAGLVERRADAADRRVWRLHLTAAAWPIIERMRGIAADVMDEALGVMPEGDRSQLNDLLEAVRSNLSVRAPVAAQY